MFLITAYLANGCIFYKCEGNSVCLPCCLLAHTIITANKCFISDFSVHAAQYNTEAVRGCKSHSVYIPMALRPNTGNGFLILRCLDHTQRNTTLSRAVLDEWSARRRAHYLKTHNRKTFMSPAGFKPTISAGDRPQNQVLECADTPVHTRLRNLYSDQKDLPINVWSRPTVYLITGHVTVMWRPP
jgi:hypothetical protein